MKSRIRTRNLIRQHNSWLWIGLAVVLLVLIIVLIVLPNSYKTVNNNQPIELEEETRPSVENHASTESNKNETRETVEEDIETSDDIPKTTPESSSLPTYASPVATPTCHHEEAGRCWDDIEDEMYSAALYDHEYGDYGASLDFPDDCDALCRDILEDAYDEGWYDYH